MFQVKNSYSLASNFVPGFEAWSGYVDDGATQHVATLGRENQRQIRTGCTQQNGIRLLQGCRSHPSTDETNIITHIV